MLTATSMHELSIIIVIIVRLIDQSFSLICKLDQRQVLSTRTTLGKIDACLLGNEFFRRWRLN
jgi:hypothetical protein